MIDQMEWALKSLWVLGMNLSRKAEIWEVRGDKGQVDEGKRQWSLKKLIAALLSYWDELMGRDRWKSRTSRASRRAVDGSKKESHEKVTKRSRKGMEDANQVEGR